MNLRTHPLRRYGPAVVMVTLVPVLSLLPARFFRAVAAGTPVVPGMDKLVHALMYAALTVSLCHALPQPARHRYRNAFAIALAATLYGLVLEVFQGVFTKTRGMDPTDALANAVGAFVAGLVACAWAHTHTRSPDQPA